MQVIIKEKKYGFIWGTACFIQVQRYLGLSVDQFLGSLQNPEVLTVVIYHGLKSWCERNGEEFPFSDIEQFILEYDTLFDNGDIYGHVVTDLLESMYMGSELHTYISKIYDIDFNGLDESKKAKKKYLSTLEKSKSNSQVGATVTKKSSTSRSKNTKSQDTETN